MTNPIQKKLSRRDAIKLLGAATGATLLANLPAKWSKPELVSGVLPAHAQTSRAGGGLHTLLCASDNQVPSQTGDPEDFGVTISPAPANGITVVMRWNAVGDDGETFLQGSTGTVDITGPADTATLALDILQAGPNVGGPINVTWSFEDPADENIAYDSCTQTNNWSSS